MATEDVAVPTWPAPVFGTMEKEDPEVLHMATLEALRAGYRYFDLAEHYKTNVHVGRAIRESGVPRGELFLTSKYDGMPVGPYEEVKRRVRALLDLCCVESFDLLLIHYPGDKDSTDFSGDPSALASPDAWTYFSTHAEESWANMRSLKRDGLVKRVGVSNFYAQHLDEISRYADEDAPVYANEIYIDPAHPESDFVAQMQSMGIRVFAYRPLAFHMILGMVDGLLDQVQASAEASGCDSPQQYILAWLLSRGIAPISSSSNPAHIQSSISAPRTVSDVSGCDAIAAQQETIDMFGGLDEYAAAFQHMSAVACE